MTDGGGKGTSVKRRQPRPWWRPRRSKAGQRIAFVVVVALLVTAAWSVWTAYETFVAYPDRPRSTDTTERVVEVPKGASFAATLELLVEHDVLARDEARAFHLFVLQEGAANRITAGEHRFRADMTPREIVTELQRRQPAQEITVTIPEGKHMLQVAEILAAAGISDAAALEAAMRDATLLKELDVPGPTFEGYLFPDTYKFPAKATPQEVVTRMVTRHRQVFDDLRRRHRAAAATLEADLGWGDHEIVTLASIVEKETGAAHERPIIAGVFLNRLRFPTFTPKLLQTDPTIIYGCTVPSTKSPACQKFEGRIRRIHLDDEDNPYNTYTHAGLPPGPISNPGRAALEAVFAPKSSRYLYFVAKNDGTHVFSKTVAEHEAWVDKYQRGG
jgi:UPF0755 protein